MLLNRLILVLGVMRVISPMTLGSPLVVLWYKKWGKLLQDSREIRHHDHEAQPCQSKTLVNGLQPTRLLCQCP